MNITVDDTDDLITYTGIWEGDGSHTSSLDIGGSHTLSSDRLATPPLHSWVGHASAYYHHRVLTRFQRCRCMSCQP